MNNMILKIAAAIAYVAMVAVNFMANGLPINGRTTGDISGAYENLFAPAGFTFSIWGLIYLLLGGYVIFLFTENAQKIDGLLRRINVPFIVTSIANAAWIFAWHYDFIGLSVLIMGVMLVSLVRIADTIAAASLTGKEKWLVSVPFGTYFGWITVATIANITVYLVSVGWGGFGIAEAVWTSLILFVGVLIGVLRLIKDRNVAYGLVLVWAYLGILFKHVSASGFDGKYPGIIITVCVGLALLSFFIGKVLRKAG